MKHISVLRGINVSGQKKIKMADLRSILEKAGLQNVTSYIQSGNLLFESKANDAAELSKLIAKTIQTAYGFDVPVLTLAPDYLRKVHQSNPFLPDHQDEINRLYYTFLAEAPSKEKVKALEAIEFKEDQIIIKNKVVYVYVPGGYGRSKFSNNFIENKLKVKATTRNWKTVNKLIELSEE